MALYTLKGPNGQLYIYEDHLEITRRGIHLKLTHFGKGDTYIDYSELDSVKLRLGTPIFSGYFHFRKVGENKNCNLIAAATDEDCIVFRFFKNKDALEIKKFLKSRI